MERLTQGDAVRARNVVAAAAKELNDELTIIVTNVAESLGMCAPEDPVRPLLLEMRESAQRCAWKAAGMLRFASRNGYSRRGRASLERLMESGDL